ncbi:MAG: diaminopimelate epimerase [Phocaeicola dorei]|jgi:diaminopimelate epimerase|uniref:Diaminopimelate epimerase n=6 Tax=Phocaeicola dorei TaxID=357276 RepID=A0A076J7S2_9BACT|nr:diaminopimelate epimerase [Phocaeicola dorei]MBO5192160.1 diaminopimelate epimerase [Bacteroides sp.]MBP6222484.1 diaminopimelate epimerase [Phocaeicola sp.]RGD25658.1 diaminopimelate epimerase [Bacteroides sp. AM23-18]RGD35689.1 diaminopimelate epimerase [Bacteroides sp. AM18-9]RGL99054.1 diaminopimelate epimerase [Bacteroides sp. 3_1_33FAA]RGP21495.1 diaminopimelate epimerase [Bacteroides sp. AF39-10AT]RJU75630.1 diaminopimelate epimerase [Bacteroides sp. AM28-6]RJV43448.1 diaminopimel
MATTIKFTKMQGAGNDYIYVNTLRHPIADPVRTSIKWSSCHTGIGSDGLVLIGKSTKADFSMRIFNADGSEAMMCGNASRCIGKYVYDNKLTQKEVITLETLSGIKILKLHTENGLVEEVTVDMDLPLLTNSRQINTPDGKMLAKTITVDGKEYKGTFVCMGNPHLVIFIDDIKNVNLPAIGPKLENHPLFPERTNVEFVEVLPDGSLRMRVWERGSGITMACGTGACATAVAAYLNHKAGRKSRVRMDGGDLQVHWNETDGHVYMTGPAVKVFDGEIEI